MKDTRPELARVVSEYRDDPARQKKELKRLLKEGMANNDIYLIGGATYYLALHSFTQGAQRTGFFSNAYKAATMLENSDNYTMAARSFNLLGIAYTAQENYQLALDSYNKALALIRAHRSCRLTKDTVMSNIAECYFHMGEYARSIRITTECLELARKKRPDFHEAFTIYGLNLSEFYEAMGDGEKANAILDDVAADAEKTEPGGSLTGYYARRSAVAYMLSDAEKGARFADLALDAVKHGFDSYEIHPDFERISHWALKNGDTSRAKYFSDILREYAAYSGHTLDEILSVRVMAEYEKETGNTARALELYTRLSELYRKRMNEEKAIQFDVQQRVSKTNAEVKRLMQKVRASEESADRDPLTGLLNRTGLIRAANDFIRRSKAKGLMLGGIFIDIDYFKEYNDTYGHAEGDEVIKLVANACLGEETASVKFARYGGDEFFGIVLGAKEKDICGVAASVCQSVRASNTVHEKNPCGCTVTLSVGIANIDMTDGGNTILDVINCSDKALYHAKGQGKNAIYLSRHTDGPDPFYRRIEF